MSTSRLTRRRSSSQERFRSISQAVAREHKPDNVPIRKHFPKPFTVVVMSSTGAVVKDLKRSFQNKREAEAYYWSVAKGWEHIVLIYHKGKEEIFLQTKGRIVKAAASTPKKTTGLEKLLGDAPPSPKKSLLNLGELIPGYGKVISVFNDGTADAMDDLGSIRKIDNELAGKLFPNRIKK